MFLSRPQAHENEFQFDNGATMRRRGGPRQAVADEYYTAQGIGSGKGGSGGATAKAAKDAGNASKVADG